MILILFQVEFSNEIFNYNVYNTPLHVAVANENIEIVKLLLKRPDINTLELDDILKHYIFMKLILKIINDFFLINLCNAPIELTKNFQIFLLLRQKISPIL